MLDWTVEEEVQLFHALSGLKPVGINKHFYIACITEKLSNSLKREVNPQSIWEHLRTMYNLEALDESQPLPFPNEECDFFLPENEFSTLLSKKRSTNANESTTDNTTINVNAASTVSIEKNAATPQPKEKKDLHKSTEVPKRSQKRTRGSTSLESNSPSTTPPPTSSNKRRRI